MGFRAHGTRFDALNCLDKNPLPDVFTLIFVDYSAFCSLVLLALKGAVHVRGGVLKSTIVVDNDMTVHDFTYIHSCFRSLSSDQV